MFTEEMIGKVLKLLPTANISMYRGAYRLSITPRISVEHTISGSTKMLVEGSTYPIPRHCKDEVVTWCKNHEMLMVNTYRGFLNEELDIALEEKHL